MGKAFLRGIVLAVVGLGVVVCMIVFQRQRSKEYALGEDRFVERVRRSLSSIEDSGSREKRLQELLRDAAYRGFPGATELLLEAGARVNAKANYGVTALHLAAKGGNVETVRLLIDHGAKIDETNDSGFTPLYFAVTGDSPCEVIKILLQHGAAIDGTNPNGNTPLHRLAFRGDAKTIEYLLSKGANPDIQRKSGDTPLHIAAQYGNPKVAQVLLNYRADITIRNKKNQAPLQTAQADAEPDHESIRGKKKVAKIIIEYMKKHRE